MRKSDDRRAEQTLSAMPRPLITALARSAWLAALVGCTSTPPTDNPSIDGSSGSTQTTGGTPAGGSAGSAGSAGALNGGATNSAGTGGALNGGTAGMNSAGSAGAAGSGGGVVGTGCKGATVCYDFESGALPTGWVPAMTQNAGATLVDGDKPHAGKYSLHMKNFSGDQPQHSYLAPLPANFGGTLWGRAFVYNTPKGPAQHGSLLKARYESATNSNIDWYEVGYELARYDGIWHNPLPPSGLPEWTLRSDTDIVLNNWTCVEWLFDGQNGSAPEAAEPRIWQDGKEVNWVEKFEFNDPPVPADTPRPPLLKATNFVSIEVGLTMYHPLPDVSNFYIDDLAFGKARVGCVD